MVRGFSRAYKRGSLYPHGWGGGTYNRTKKAFQNKLHGSSGQNTFWIYSFQYKLEVGGGSYIRGVYSGGSRGGVRAHPPKECSIWYPSTLKLTCFWASSKFEKLRQSKYGCHGTSSRHAGRTTRKCCAIKKWSHLPCLRRHFFPARFPICFLFGFLEFQTDRFDLKKPDH